MAQADQTGHILIQMIHTLQVWISLDHPLIILRLQTAEAMAEIATTITIPAAVTQIIPILALTDNTEWVASAEVTAIQPIKHTQTITVILFMAL